MPWPSQAELERQSQALAQIEYRETLAALEAENEPEAEL